ncbi:MAG TPA: hypothetical protein VI278_15565 [Nitrososphaeraceae archaeon]
MTTISHILIKDKDKPSVSDRSYILCDICEFHGYPNEKVVYRYEGLRSEDQEGFIIRFAVYDYPVQSGKIHVHRWNDELINRLVNQSLGKVTPS